MLIKEDALKHWIDNFYGYGSWQARFWLIGYEEPGGEIPEEVADKINYFYNAHPQPGEVLCDIRDVYKNVSVRWEGPKASSYKNMHEYRFDENAVQHGVWKNLIAFVHGYLQMKIPDVLQYQQRDFLAKNHEALIQLYPLPSPHTHSWYYSWLEVPQLGFLKSRSLYEKHVYDQRMKTILSNIPKYKPDLILMYGMENINALKDSVQNFFPNARFRMIKAEKQLTPQHHRVDLNGTKLLITTQIPALRHNRIETGFDWEEFGKRVKTVVDPNNAK